MDKIFTVKDLEKYRFQEPPYKVPRYSQDKEIVYMVPREWFLKFDDLYRGKASEHNRFNNATEEIANIVKKWNHKINEDHNNAGGFVVDIEEQIRSTIEVQTTCYDLFKSEYKDEPVLQKLIEASLKYNGWKHDMALINIFSYDYNVIQSFEKPVKQDIVKLLVNVNSWTDVVTNSSSELFVCASEHEGYWLEKLICDHAHECDEYVEVSANLLEYDEIAKMIITDGHDYLAETINLEEWGITDDDIQELRSIIHRYHHYSESEYTLMYILYIDQSATNTIKFAESELGAIYLENA